MNFAIALTGPTASGKTALSFGIARRFGCEILSLDSMQIYRGMDIGTAKPTAAERASLPHHLIDVTDPGENFSAADYRDAALAETEKLAARGVLPLFVGGTGLYLSMLTRGVCPEVPGEDPAIRSALQKEYETEEGAGRVYARLCEVDPEAAAKTHKNNARRVIRALEIYEVTGKTKTEWDRASLEAEPPLCVCHLTLDAHRRETLSARIDRRVDEMMAQGLEKEVRDLVTSGRLSADTTAGGAIGYKEFFPYFSGERTLAETVEEIKLRSRQYAKRQLTWFRACADAHTLYIDTPDGTLRDPAELLAEAETVIADAIRDYKHANASAKETI